ncbi:helix-turn-helix domain-containing protein, partial [Aeromonas sp. HMWF016]|uniref:helix-turn-helix domain-containing protein n=1 Tax=Aeromonas sp. HMWF016 TaxID=2056852 RepID=UPI000D487FC1
MFLSRQVNQFIAAVQEGSFLKASEKISITPSAMSRGIGELEHKIGDRLIKRTRNGVQTTEKGEWLYQKILPHYNCIKKLTDELKIHCKRREIII